MDYASREQIFSKDILNVNDIMNLLEMSYGQAADFIRTVKRKITYNGGTPRDDRQGKLHVQDYLEYFAIPTNSERYGKIKIGGYENAGITNC